MSGNSPVKMLMVLPVLLTLAACAETTTSNVSGKPWSYAGDTGPANWSKLSPAYKACEGKFQSPVDLKSPLYAKDTLAPKVAYRSVPLLSAKTSHGVDVDLTNAGTLRLGGVEYKTKNIHFHAPSEHTLGGKSTAAEAQITHVSKEGKVAVLSILFREGKKSENLERVLRSLDAKAPKNVSINVAKLLPKNSSFYRYEGSLTTPPCSEGVTWTVFQNPIEASKEQLTKLYAITGGNARPVQPLGERKLLSK